MNQKQLFERKLTQFIAQQSPQWLSQGACPIHLITLTWFEVSRWRCYTEPDGTVERRLQEQADQAGNWRAMADEFVKYERVISVRRPSSTAGLYDLYILVYFGHWWVGLQTQLQEG